MTHAGSIAARPDLLRGLVMTFGRDSMAAEADAVQRRPAPAVNGPQQHPQLRSPGLAGDNPDDWQAQKNREQAPRE